MSVRVLIKPFRMLLELLVLAGFLLWALLCLLGNSIQKILRFTKTLVLGLLSFIRTLAVGLLILVKSLTLGVWFLIRGLVVGLHRVVVLVTWTIPRFVLKVALGLLCQVTLWLWQGIRYTLPYSVLLCAGFLAVHLLWVACRSQSVSEVLRTLNLTPHSRPCPF